MVKQRNEYVTNQTDVSASMFYILGKPEPPTQHTLTNSIKPDGNNTITFKWNKNDNTGFSTRELSVGTLENSLSNKVISINRYRAIIEADRVNSKSPYYRLDRTSYGNTPTLRNIDISNGVSRDANLYLQADADDGIIDKNDVYTDTSGNPVSDISHVLVYPETTYTFSIYPRNRFFLESDNSLNVTMTTSVPTANKLQLTGGTIPLNSSYNDLNNDFSYAQKGFLLESSINTPPSNYVLYQITKAYDTNLNSISASITHRINKNKFNDFLVDNDTDENPNEYISATSQLNNKKLRQFRIYNVGESPSALLYVYGSDSTFADISSNNTNGTSMEGMISISASDIKDEYSVTGKDPFNQGYWWQENMSYSISIDDSIPNLYKNPVKLEFHTRYNNKLDSSSNFNNSSLERYDDVVDVSRIILQNSQNTNQVVYFDELQLDPAASQNGTTDMIQISNFTNKINGVPNLYKISNSYGYDISLNYKLENYSEYYGLDSGVNFVSHTFTDISKADVAPRNWGSKSQCTRDPSGWTINNLPINETTNGLGDVSSNTTSNVQIQLNMENMYGTSNHTIGTSDSTIHKFIYDKKSVDYFIDISSSMMEIPNNFDPTYDTGTSGTTSTAPTIYTSYGLNNSNNLQMSMWNGYFYSNQGWQAATGINSTNNTPYNMSNSLPVFDTTTTNYRWSIFKYSYTPTTGDFSFYKVMVFLGDNTNITVDDIKNQNVRIFIHTGSAISSYYWLNISKKTSTTDSQANGGNMGYEGGIGDESIANISSNTAFIASSDFIGNGKFTNNFTRSFSIKRLIPGRVNSIKISNNSTQIIYVAIGIKNSQSRYVSRPNVQIANSTSETDTKTLSPS